MARKIDNRQSENRLGTQAEKPQLGPQAEVPGVKGEITLAHLDSVSGGGSHNIGSQSSGAGAGKVTFNPF